MDENYLTEANFDRTIKHYATKADIAGLEAQIARSETRLIKWMIGLIVAAVLAISAVVTMAYRVLL